VLRVAAEVEPLAREDEERVAVGGGEGLEAVRPAIFSPEAFSPAPPRVDRHLRARLRRDPARWSLRRAKATLDRFGKTCRAGEVVQAKSISSREQGSRLLKAANQLWGKLVELWMALQIWGGRKVLAWCRKGEDPHLVEPVEQFGFTEFAHLS